jgi:hypothetical protein
MRYVALSGLLFILGLALTQIEREEMHFTPVVRVRTADGLFFTVVQPGTSSRNTCSTTVEELVGNFGKACGKCLIESSECASRLQGVDLALASAQPVPIYTVTAEGVRIGILGPPENVRHVCETIAGAMVNLGVKSASCAFPRSEARITSPKS